ncbi:MAG: ATP-binding cassette domain-containing protein [Candidatus Moraniibacteriota bacterium]|nr:MAG: ATP-binding cassette domain-containing protein [Candidatus Moranbacteria bacterium]
MIRFENVAKVYPGDVSVLQDINLFIEPGEFVSFVGASGAGKSTLLKLLYAEEEPTAGEIFFSDRSIGTIKRRLLPYYRRNFGTVFQDFKLLSQRTVFENVAYALEVDGKSALEIAEEVPQILDIVRLTEKADKYPRQLSGGEQQRVSLARALVHRPSVLIADEPTGNLDPTSASDIIRLLLEINKMGTIVLLATHNKPIVDGLQKRVVTLGNGTIVRDEKQGKYIV